MRILAYGEDALTLWALTRRLSAILEKLHDASDATKCQVLYRPSFGRRGGFASSQFGEFDFIFLADGAVYLGESKWDRSSEEVAHDALVLRPEQLIRHQVFRFYLEEFAFGTYSQWVQFNSEAAGRFAVLGVGKSLAPAGTLLAANLEQVLLKIRCQYQTKPSIRNVLLYLHGAAASHALPAQGPPGFELVTIDYSQDADGNFIPIEM